MKPLLIVPPAPRRWAALQDLLGHQAQPWLRNIELRLTQGVPRAQDAYAVAPENGRIIAVAGINKCGDLGVLGQVYTRPEHRRRGWARKLTETVLSWFDMTGGKWLHLATTGELDEGLYRKFGFVPLRRAVWAPYDRITMLRARPNANADPLAGVGGAVTVRDLTRADWPEMFTLLQYRNGPDPRVPLDESAVSAEVFTLDLIDHLEKRKCGLLGAYQGRRLVGLAAVAADRPPGRTYAMLVPHSGAAAALRGAAEAFAGTQGYEGVDFPMETVECLTAGAAYGKLDTPHTADTPPPATDEPPPVA